ncbi:MAG TPA: methyltransferase domain-containing protein [Vicinamibacterales bacterium]|nr:methyltransferase domain-containing protein [Vicinamibacterales bacterium]
MKRDLTDLLCCPDCQDDLSLHDETASQPEVETGTLACGSCGASYPIVRGIPRFVSSDQYVGSFSYEWNRWNKVQLDVENGGNESEQTFAEKTGFTPEDLRGKLVLDVGCGAGRFLDVASRWGARVVGVDLSFAVEASQKNLGHRPNVSVIQADVFRLPFRAKSFDAIFSLGVLHHSRDTREAFLRLPPLLADGGDIAVWLYYYPDRLYSAASDFWRAVLRPLPTWAVYAWSWLLVTLFSRLWLMPFMSRTPWLHLRRILPVNTHPKPEWRVLDTFDWYSPRYQDKECSPARVVGWCKEGDIRDVQVLTFPTSIRGRRDESRTVPLIRWDIPDVRERRVLVFGAGAAGQAAVRFLSRIAPGRVVGVVDNDPNKKDTQLEGFRVRSFESVARDTYDLVVIASLPGLQPISAQLRASGLVANEHVIAAGQVEQWHKLLTDYESLAA